MKKLIALFLVVLIIATMRPTVLAAEPSLDNFTQQRIYQNLFADVPSGAWFHGVVKRGFELGLIDGTSGTTFAPNDNVTVGQILALASRLHSIYNTGEASFNEGTPWFQVYVDYARDNGFLISGLDSFTRPALRGEVAAILARVLPSSALAPKNTVEDNALPDIKMDSPFADEIYLLYRAGILTGSDDRGTFRLNNRIRRSEIAAIIARMALPESRVERNIENISAPTMENPVETTIHPVEMVLSRQNITDWRLAEMVRSGEIPPNITHLKLSLNPITDVSPLGSLTGLVELDLWGCDVADVSPLGNLTNLQELVLWGNQFEDIRSLGNLRNLKRLSLGDNLQFNGDLSVLRNFVNLTDLGLGDTWQGRMDYSPLRALVNLEDLQLWGAGQLSDLSIIGRLTELTRLTIHAANIRDFSPLDNLTKLTSLDLQVNRISDISILRLYRFPNLTSLYLWDNQITDVSELRSFTNLETLALGGNQITDVSPIKNLTNLTYLNLARNPIAQRDIDELTAVLPGCQIEFRD